MTELEILKSLDGNTYKVYKFLELTAGERKVIHNIKREDIEKECDLGYTKTYQALKTLKEMKLIEYRGQQQFIKILSV